MQDGSPNQQVGDLLRGIPSIDRLLQEPGTAGLLAAFPRDAVVDALRAAVATMRDELRQGRAPERPLVEHLLGSAEATLTGRFRSRLRGVVNATGVVLHTNLGRAPLGSAVVEALELAASRYVNLEFDLESGRRGHRSDLVAPLLCELTGAEAACVVNNNAASVLLILDTFARGREVVVARSELIEIGGSFRLPEVLERSGAILVEVGATNKVYARDYERAANERTALLLKSHPSNFRMIGFVHEVAMDELAELGRRRRIPTVLDLGSGVMLDLAAHGLPGEPTVRECVASGLDLVCFSGDKLLGGPQAGIIVGRAEAVARCASNPLMRALRCDKLILAALQATLQEYRWPEDRVRARVPALAMLTRPAAELEAAARALAAALQAELGGRARVAAEPGASLPGGGSLPGHDIPTWLVAVSFSGGGEGAWADALRGANPPVIVRAEDERLLLDVRTLMEGDAERIRDAFRQVAAGLG